MGRKNDRVRTRNRRDGYGGSIPVPHLASHGPVSQVKPSEYVIPDGSCTFQTKKPKARFATKEKAALALAQAQRKRKQTNALRVEKRYYECPEGGCGGFHLTAREEFDDSIRKLREEQFKAKTKNTRLAEIRAEQEGTRG